MRSLSEPVVRMCRRLGNEIFFAFGASSTIAAKVWRQGSHPLVTMSSCLEKWAMGLYVPPPPFWQSIAEFALGYHV